MSGIAGVFMRSGAPADRFVVAAMSATTPHRAPDGAWTIADGCFAAVRQRTVVTPEDCFEHGPVGDPASKLVMLFDGRLDNRGELIAMLRVSTISGACDAQIALEAWKRWGADAPARLVGDFAFVVWNPVTRTLSCARDSMGVRPFYYYLSDDAFVFGSEVRQLLAHPLVPRAPDEVMVADVLTVQGRFPERTLYRDVLRLPHARTLVVDPIHCSVSRYWRLDLGRELTLANDREYADAFREVFDRAVAARLRARGPIGAHLSGGLDSSSVVVTARAISDAPLATFSLVYPGRSECDEQRFSEAVIARTRADAVRVEPPRFVFEAACAQVESRRYLSDYPNDAMFGALGQAMSARGLRVALTGFGGDDGLTGSFFHCADLVANGHLVRFARRYRDVLRYLGMRWYSAEAVRASFWPALPLRVRGAVRPFVRRAVKPQPRSYLTRAFSERTGLLHPPAPADVPTGLGARYDVIQSYESSWNHAILDATESASAELQIERRHPFYDRRLIEFVVSLPDDQRWQHGTTKYVLRGAMRGRLPDDVRLRSDASKADFSHRFVDTLDALGGEAFFSDRLHVAANEWVIPGEARAMYLQMRRMLARGDFRYADVAWSLWTIAAVEIWFRGVFLDAANRSRPWAA